MSAVLEEKDDHSWKRGEVQPRLDRMAARPLMYLRTLPHCDLNHVRGITRPPIEVIGGNRLAYPLCIV